MEFFHKFKRLGIFGRNFHFVLGEYNWIGGGTWNFSINSNV